MSLGIIFKGPEGIVLAADSRVTLTSELSSGAGQPTKVMHSTFDNANKLLQVNGQDFVGVVTYGVGAIGQQEPRTAHSYIPEFESELTKNKVSRLSVEDFANKLGDFFLKHWNANMPSQFAGNGMIFLVGGYDEGDVYGKVFEIQVPHSPKAKEYNSGLFGITWGGQSEILE